MTTTAEHLAWCKKRALGELEHSGVVNCWNSMLSDMGKHEGTRGHQALQQGQMMMQAGLLDDKAEMKRFIEGFN